MDRGAASLSERYGAEFLDSDLCFLGKFYCELVGLVHSLTPKPESAKLVWWKRPEALAAAILLAVIALNIFFY